MNQNQPQRKRDDLNSDLKTLNRPNLSDIKIDTYLYVQIKVIIYLLGVLPYEVVYKILTVADYMLCCATEGNLLRLPYMLSYKIIGTYKSSNAEMKNEKYTLKNRHKNYLKLKTSRNNYILKQKIFSMLDLTDYKFSYQYVETKILVENVWKNVIFLFRY